MELKPCPFCGGEAKIYRSKYDAFVGCDKCHISTWSGDSEQELVDAWNRRASDNA